MWKKIRLVIWCSLFAVSLAGCNKKEEEQELSRVSAEEFIYTVSKEAVAIAVDEEGLLYTLCSTSPSKLNASMTPEEYAALQESEEADSLWQYGQRVEVFDAEGTLVLQKQLRFASGPVQKMLLEDGKLYCIAFSETAPQIYVIDTTTWEVSKLAELAGAKDFVQMASVDGYLYVLARMGGSADSYSLHPDVWLFDYKGEQICRISLTEEKPAVEKMKVDFPLGIYATEQDTLMIYQYTEAKGFGFLEFYPKEMKLTEHEWSHGRTARSYISSCGAGYLYRDSYNILSYGTPKGVQVQLLPEEVDLDQPPVYGNGYVFLLEWEHGGKVRRLWAEEFIRGNKELRVLTDDTPNDFPFGCGYQMTTHPATPDEFALKVLAQDSDFDLFLLDTRNDCAYNLRRNGAFYDLSDVDGVQEYLDACFPYIKEMAYNEDGDIWMIPVDVDIPGLVYSREFCETKGVDYSKMNFMEFLELVEKTEAEEPEKIRINIGVILEQMLMQYLLKYDTFDTEVFRTHISKLKQVYTDATSWGNESVYGHSLVEGIPAEFYMDFSYNSEWFETLTKNEMASRAYGPTVFPKLSEDIGNVGTITLIAVNPASGNLKETLKYITSYCNYMLTVRDSFVLAEESMYTTENLFIKDMYYCYADGVIEFRMADEVYQDVCWNYLYGEMELEDAIAEIERRRKMYLEE